MEEDKRKNNNTLVIILALLLILSSATSMYLYFNGRSTTSSSSSNQQATTEKTPEELIKQVNDESKAIDEKITKVDKETDYNPKTDDIKTIVNKIDLLNKEFSQE